MIDRFILEEIVKNKINMITMTTNKDSHREQSKLCKKFENPEIINQTAKYNCFCPKQALQRKNYRSVFENGCKTILPWWLGKTLLTRRTSTTRSLSYFLYVFIIWTLLIAPVLSDLIRSSLLFRHRILFGGVALTTACHPGATNGGGTRPRPTVDLSPFQKNEYIPKMSEQTIGASGPAEGAIHRDSKRYNDELFPNWNPDIVFRDEEQTNEDRMMTKRCMDRLNELAVWVANQWPGIKLRVTEGWDDPNTEIIHPENSLHYEGRAVDITTTDQDESKYPILARLAVEAGFDWVYYEKTHVHCSVKSDSSEAALRGGCFPGDAMVPVPGGAGKRMKDLRPGDKVFSADANGNITPDTLLTFMDVQLDVHQGKMAERAFVSLTTDGGQTLRLTHNHLVYASSQDFTLDDQEASYYNSKKFQNHSYSLNGVFAGNIKVGQFIFATPSSRFLNRSSAATTRRVKVVNVDVVTSATGAYAPLTTRGTIVVDETLASCYAVFENDSIAHLVMTPNRWYHAFRLWLWPHFATRLKQGKNPHLLNDEEKIELLSKEEGISFYSKILYDLSYNFIPSSMLWKN